MFQFVKNLFIYFFSEPGGVRKMVSIRISRKRLQWAEISFSGTCHEADMRLCLGRRRIPLWTGVDNAMCGRCV